MSGTVSQAEGVEYVLGMFGAARSSGRMGELVKFHTRNKYLIMAHDQGWLGSMGRVVANHDGLPAEEAFDRYEKLLRGALGRDATASKHANAVMRMCGHFLPRLDERSRTALLDMVAGYRRGDIRLGRLLEAISNAVHHLDEAYLAGQTYFLLYCDTRGGAAGIADALPERA